MTIQEFVRQLPSVPLQNNTISAVEEVYCTSFPEIIKQIISCADHGHFFDNDNFCRQLSLDDILHAQRDLHVDFTSHGIIPLFDKMDNDYVVYHFRKEAWSMFNIVDESFFMNDLSLEKLLS